MSKFLKRINKLLRIEIQDAFKNFKPAMAKVGSNQGIKTRGPLTLVSLVRILVF
jgi:hypothetical protein